MTPERPGEWSRKLIVTGGILGLIALSLALMVSQPGTEILTVSSLRLEYPRSWILERGIQGSTYIIREQSGRARVIITSTVEPRLLEDSGRIAITNEIERELTHNPLYDISGFKWIMPNRGAEINGYVAVGELQRRARYDFTEVGIVDGEMLTTFRGEVLSEARNELGPVVDEILLSLRGQPRTSRPAASILLPEEAIEKVKQLPDIASYEAELQHAGKTIRFKVEDGADVWIVSAYARLGSVASEVKVGRWKVHKATGAVSTAVL